jgi:hypothetical protein
MQVSVQQPERYLVRNNPEIAENRARVAAALSLRVVPVADLVIRLHDAASRTVPDYVVATEEGEVFDPPFGEYSEPRLGGWRWCRGARPAPERSPMPRFPPCPRRAAGPARPAAHPRPYRLALAGGQLPAQGGQDPREAGGSGVEVIDPRHHVLGMGEPGEDRVDHVGLARPVGPTTSAHCSRRYARICCSFVRYPHGIPVSTDRTL